MTILPTRCVVDASAGIKMILEEEHSDIVRQYFGHLAFMPPLLIYVPDLFFVECANILWKKVRRGEVTLADSQIGLAWLSALNLPITSTSVLSEQAVSIGCTFGITAYDATYVALAEQINLPLLTADNRLAKALTGSRFQVITLDDVATSS